MRTAIANALQRQGHTVVAANQPATRKLELHVLERKTDIMARIEMLYDLTPNVHDDTGALLAKSSTRGEEVVSADFESTNSVSSAKAFELRFTELVRDEAVRGALAGPDR